jgi:hypothetical protein
VVVVVVGGGVVVVPVPLVVVELVVVVVDVFGHGQSTTVEAAPVKQSVYVSEHPGLPSGGQNIGGAQAHPTDEQQFELSRHRQAEKSNTHLHRPAHGAAVVVVVAAAGQAYETRHTARPSA